jgi:hypothetical protein
VQPSLGTKSVRLHTWKKVTAAGSTRLRPIHFNRGNCRGSQLLGDNHYRIVIIGKKKFFWPEFYYAGTANIRRTAIPTHRNINRYRKNLSSVALFRLQPRDEEPVSDELWVSALISAWASAAASVLLLP